MELSKIINTMSIKRPVFHSEADFQHALAWEIQTAYPDSQIRLEYVIPKLRYHMDILVHIDGAVIPIELKYKTRKGTWDIDGEHFEAVNHSARDIARYDFIKDIFRIEQTVQECSSPYGYAILLTNDYRYWLESDHDGTIDAAFKLHDARTLSGTVAWAAHAGAGSVKNREMPITLSGQYSLHWQDYSNLPKSKNGKLRYLMVQVSG